MQNILLDKDACRKSDNNCFLSISRKLSFTCPVTYNLLLLADSI
jgi:hypothetical protein